MENQNYVEHLHEGEFSEANKASFDCEECGRVFKCFNWYEKHIKNAHSNSENEHEDKIDDAILNDGVMIIGTEEEEITEPGHSTLNRPLVIPKYLCKICLGYLLPDSAFPVHVGCVSRLKLGLPLIKVDEREYIPKKSSKKKSKHK